MALEKKVGAAGKALKEQQKVRAGVAAEAAAKQEELDTVAKYNAKAKKSTAKLDKQEAEADQDVLKSLKRLVTLNEQLKSQESEFKSGVRKQMKELKALSEGMGDASLSPEDDEKIKKIEENKAFEHVEQKKQSRRMTTSLTMQE